MRDAGVIDGGKRQRLVRDHRSGPLRLLASLAVPTLATVLLVVASAPGAVSAVLEGGGDWSTTGSTCATPNNAISDDNVRALCANSGETVVARNFGLQSVVPSGATDISFVAIVRGRVSDNDNTDVFNVSLSHDGGTTYSPATPVPTDQVNNEIPGDNDSTVEAPAAGSTTS
jgi:hypothetical protein